MLQDARYALRLLVRAPGFALPDLRDLAYWRRSADGPAVVRAAVLAVDPALTILQIADFRFQIEFQIAIQSALCILRSAISTASLTILQIADFRFQIEFQIAIQSALCTLHSAISTASLGIVWIGLRFGVAWRRIASTSRMGFARAVGNPWAQRYLAFADFLD